MASAMTMIGVLDLHCVHGHDPKTIVYTQYTVSEMAATEPCGILSVSSKLNEMLLELAQKDTNYNSSVEMIPDVDEPSESGNKTPILLVPST